MPRTWRAALTWYPARLAEALERSVADHDAMTRAFAEHDLWFLLVFVLNRPDVGAHPWLFDRCREVEASPDGHLDLWARYHYKSTIITFGMSMLDIIRDREVTIGIFSHTRPIAKAFLKQMKGEMERNKLLPRLWPETFWQDPANESPKWSEDEGLTVRRESNPKECTIEAWGFTDGMPTSRHYRVRLYDDVVTKEAVQSKLMMDKVLEAWELSINLGMPGGVERTIGTRWHLYDLYHTQMERGVVSPRIYAATHNGQAEGRPVMLSQAEWNTLRKKQRKTLAAQMLQSPLADGAATFDPKTLRGYQLRPQWLNVYIMVDPSKGPQAQSKDSDNTAIAVVGISSSGARYLLDGYCHRMRMSDRWKLLSALYRKWTREPGVLTVAVGYEQYGMQTDLEYLNLMMDRTGTSFSVEALAWPREGGGSKSERIERIEPYCNTSQFFIPILVSAHLAPTLGPQLEDGQPVLEDGKPARWRYATWSVHPENDAVIYRGLRADTRTIQQAQLEGRGRLVIKPLVRRDENGDLYDLTARFIAEFTTHPVGQHDDLIDCVSRIEDMKPTPAAVGAMAPPGGAGARPGGFRD